MTTTEKRKFNWALFIITLIFCFPVAFGYAIWYLLSGTRIAEEAVEEPAEKTQGDSSEDELDSLIDSYLDELPEEEAEEAADEGSEDELDALIDSYLDELPEEEAEEAEEEGSEDELDALIDSYLDELPENEE